MAYKIKCTRKTTKNSATKLNIFYKICNYYRCLPKESIKAIYITNNKRLRAYYIAPSFYLPRWKINILKSH